MKRYTGIFFLFFAAVLFACDEDEIVKDYRPIEDSYKGQPVYVMNDLSHHWNLFLQSSSQDDGVKGFARYLDTSKGQYMQTSLGNLRDLSPLDVSILNVMLNSDFVGGYSPEDIANLKSVPENGGSLCFFYSGEAKKLDGVNTLGAEFGFTMTAGDVAVPVKTTGELGASGTDVAIAGKGAKLTLATPADWKIVMKDAAGEAVMAYQESGSGKVLVSAVNIFGQDADGNLLNDALVKAMVPELSNGKIGPASNSVLLKKVLGKRNFVQDKVTLLTNDYQQNYGEDLSALLDDAFKGVDDYLELEAKSNKFSVDLLSTDQKIIKSADRLSVGLFYSGYPDSKEGMVEQFITAIADNWMLYKDPIEDEALRVYLSAVVAKSKGLDSDKILMPYLALANDPANAQKLKEYDPITMTDEQKATFPKDLRLAKYIKALVGITEDFGPESLSKYLTMQDEVVPKSESYDFTGHDAVWIWDKLAKDKNEDADLFPLFNQMGYMANRDKVTLPASLGADYLDRSEWEVIFASDEETIGEGSAKGWARNAFDGNKGTNWHSQYRPSSPGFPHEVQFDMGKEATVIGFSKEGRKQFFNGLIGKFALYVSNDLDDWGTPVATGEWKKVTYDELVVYTTAQKKGRYVRFVALTPLIDPNGGNQDPKAMVISEFKVIGVEE
ncbi:hypothetical protein FUAX_44030 (plasmid) [Fulvitalea axinellae]|uniref:F5/8 type C domain-containing protein n=1 Tax=Fulvitalea axinellae TaxID=1182444 RepID=A0AAU9CS70_9BACT|nr:hypothetical protein FUAX_44030 [Fulvitalea axinellae]